MVIATPISRFLRRRSSPVFTAFCDGALVLSAAAVIAPSRPWAGIVAAILATLPEWLNIAWNRRSAKMAFAPDPLTPDFATFTVAFLESAAKCTTERMSVKWTLCPFCGNDGTFKTYRLDLRPTKGEIAIGADAQGQCTKTDIVFRPRLPLPVEVRDTPLTLVLSPAGARRQVFIDADRKFSLLWNRRGGNRLQDDIAKLWPTLAFAIAAAFPDSAIAAPERLAAIAVVLVFATFALARKRA